MSTTFYTTGPDVPVTGVTASSPLSATISQTPNISLSGIVSIAHGGTNSSTALTNGLVVVSSGGKIVEGSITSAKLATMPVWTKYSLTHTDLAAASTSNTIQLFSLPAKGIIHTVILKSTTQFSGGAISSYVIAVGIQGNLTKYSDGTYDVTTAVSGTFFQLGVSQPPQPEDFGSATSIKIAAVSVGANLDQASAGALDVYVETSLLP